MFNIKGMKTRYSNREVTLIRAWGEWIESMNWTYFCTLTTPYPLTLTGARFKMDKFIELIQGKTESKLSAFWVAETFKSSNYHVHALIAVPVFAIDQFELKNCWISSCGNSKRGNLNKSQIDIYEKGKGAYLYTVKYLMRSDVDYEIIC